MTSTSSCITGLLLAGGQGRRMRGADKGLMIYQGQPLAAWVYQALRPQVSTLLISANRHASQYACWGEVICDAQMVGHESNHLGTDPAEVPSSQSNTKHSRDADQHAGASISFQGPLAGIYAGLKRCQTPWLAVAPCDLPHLPNDVFVTLMQAAELKQAAAAFAQVNGRHTLVCLIARQSLSLLAEFLVSGQRRVVDYYGALSALPVSFANAAAFKNINTLDALNP